METFDTDRLNRALFDAIVTNDLAGARQSLDAGAEPSFADPRYGWQMLYWAADKGYALIAESLPHHGADSNTRGFEGESSLHAAGRWGNTGVACVLLGYGADVNAPDERGRTPLHRAVQYGRVKCTLLFLQCGADPHIRDASRRYPRDPVRRAQYQDRVSRAIKIVQDWELGVRDFSILEPELASLGEHPPEDNTEMRRRLIEIGCALATVLPVRPLRANLKYHEYAEHRRRAALDRDSSISVNY